jgi:hypothetical protein
MVFFAGPLKGIAPAPGAPLTGLPTPAASTEITNSVASAEKTTLVTERLKGLAGGALFLMANDIS